MEEEEEEEEEEGEEEDRAWEEEYVDDDDDDAAADDDDDDADDDDDRRSWVRLVGRTNRPACQPMMFAMRLLLTLTWPFLFARRSQMSSLTILPGAFILARCLTIARR